MTWSHLLSKYLFITFVSLTNNVIRVIARHQGNLRIYNLENPSEPLYVAKAHDGIINSIDGVAGQSVNCGAPELVTGSSDGSVKVWDPRQKDRPVAEMEATRGTAKRDCWAVTFGNSFNTEERVVVAGYDNGDVKMFDLRSMSLSWESNLRNGVCSLEFDRKDIAMNKLVATTLESKLYVFDVRTSHPKRGYPFLTEKVGFVMGREFLHATRRKWIGNSFLKKQFNRVCLRDLRRGKSRKFLSAIAAAVSRLFTTFCTYSPLITFQAPTR